MADIYRNSSILISANGRLSQSITICLLQAGHDVTLVTNDKANVSRGIDAHRKDIMELGLKKNPWGQLDISAIFYDKPQSQLGIAITSENICEKKAAIRQLEDHLPTESIIAINTESIPLSVLQQDCYNPERVIGLNWVEPAHTSFFLEIIINAKTNKKFASDIMNLAKTCWNKDPYLVDNNVSIRAKMFSAMAREAFYLVHNGYASVEDVDRACRNDPGYYLPFSGNFRYMDLMGPYAYGLVMKELNRELSIETSIPAFFDEIIRQGGLGMENDIGFYTYGEEDAGYWERLFSKFSYRIKEIIQKYPFNYRITAGDEKTLLQ